MVDDALPEDDGPDEIEPLDLGEVASASDAGASVPAPRDAVADTEPYQSLYRRYRPQRFSEVRGQEHVTRALRNAVRDGKVSHAYLFSGPRGTGKTSTARILAMALNCENPDDGEPCGVCASCIAVRRGSSLDVHELDAASNRKLDEMRDLLSRVALGTSGRWKVYIVDEVHQLTSDAASALLKTLEEPPGHVIFVLATTDPQKVLPTIRSRTQHFEFHLLGSDVLAGLLGDVNTRAGLGVPPEAIDLVVRRGHGSARDALSVLDQVAAAGSVDDETAVVADIVEALADRDVGRVLTAVAECMSAGRDPRRLAVDLLDHLRNGFLATQARGLVLLPDDAVAEVEAQAQRLGLAALVRAMEVIGQASTDMRDAVDPRVALEVALVRLASPAADVSPGALLARIEQLEQKLAGGVPLSAVPGAPGVSAGPSAPAVPVGPARSPARPAPAAPAAAARSVGPAVAAGPVVPAGSARAAAPPAPAPAPPAARSVASAAPVEPVAPAGADPEPLASPSRGEAPPAPPSSSSRAASVEPGALPVTEGQGTPDPNQPAPRPRPMADVPAAAAATAPAATAAAAEQDRAPGDEVAPAPRSGPGPRPGPGERRSSRPSLGTRRRADAPQSAGPGPRPEQRSGSARSTDSPTPRAGALDPAAVTNGAAPELIAVPPSTSGESLGRPSAGEMPTRDELTKAWGDVVLPSLPARLRAYLALGRFTSVESQVAVYALPDQGLLSRAESVRQDFEGVLAAHFGRRVPLRLILDPDTQGGPSPADDAGPPPADDDPSVYDLATMEDVEAAVMSPEQRLLDAFPGAEEVEL